MKEIVIREKPLTRRDLADPLNMKHRDRLIKAKVVDLRDNCIIEETKIYK